MRPLHSCIFVFALSLTGCTTMVEHSKTVLHELKPHRLWRLNRHPAPRRDVYYSVTDPLPVTPADPNAPSAK